jgi:hypothetical protein
MRVRKSAVFFSKNCFRTLTIKRNFTQSPFAPAYVWSASLGLSVRAVIQKSIFFLEIALDNCVSEYSVPIQPNFLR